MPIRAIKLKLIVPRDDSEASRRARQALLDTHCFMNEAVAHYERLLLELRQGDVCVGRKPDGSDEVLPARHYQDELRKRLAKKGMKPPEIEAALPLLQDWYGRLVPAAVGEKGTSQGMGSYLGLMVVAGTEAFRAAEAKRDALMPLRDAVLAERPASEWVTLARQVVAANERTLLASTGAPNAWVKAYRAASDDPRWVELLSKTVLETVADDAEVEARDRLRTLGVFPLATPYGAGRLESASSLTLFERTAFAQAIAHMNAWESWDALSRAQVEARRARVEAWNEAFGASHADALAAIRAFEQRRAEQLAREAFEPVGTYRIRSRELRGWERLREWLLKHPAASEVEATAFVHELQGKLGRGFGGEQTLRWLAAPEQRWIVQHPQGDVVSRIAALNLRLGVLERSRQHATFTRAEPWKHPRYAEFDPPANNNMPHYDVVGDVDGRLLLRVELLVRAESGLLTSEKLTFQLAPSGQARHPLILAQGKVRRLERDGTLPGERVRGQIGGAALILERARLEVRRLGGVWIKLAVDVGDVEADTLQRRSRALTWLSSSPLERPKKPALPDRARILAVDLGLRSAVAFSIFEVGCHDNAPQWPLHPKAGVDVHHVRSGLLTLPGERVDAEVTRRREDLDRGLRATEASVRHLQTLRRLCMATSPEQRRETLDALIEVEPGRTAPVVRLSEEQRTGLRALADADTDAWRLLADPVYRDVETRLAAHVKAWRGQTRSRGSSGVVGGKSAWAVEHLERVRKVLIRWNRHQRPADQDVRRLDRSAQGTYARRLLNHITALKGDRVKTTADLIVQTARGLSYQDGRWVQDREPVDVIVMEDLSRYRFRTDRPRRENSQLMQWSHREILAAVQLQAEEAGIRVSEAPAAFSSRFDARTGAPGVRCHALTKAEVAEIRERGDTHPLVRACGDHLREADLSSLREGHLLPTGSGELLVSLAEGEALRVRHADINAAQGLARRYLEGCGIHQRVRVRKVGAVGAWISDRFGKRMSSAFGGSLLVLRPAWTGAEHAFAHQVFNTERAAAKALGLQPQALATQEEEDSAQASRPVDARGPEGDDEQEAAELLERSGDAMTCFRDPSGLHHRGHWVESRVFFGSLTSVVVSRLRATGRLPQRTGG